MVTPELAAWLDRKTVSRPELTRFFWAYIKERGLQVRSGHLCFCCLQARCIGLVPDVPHLFRSHIRLLRVL